MFERTTGFHSSSMFLNHSQTLRQLPYAINDRYGFRAPTTGFSSKDNTTQQSPKLSTAEMELLFPISEDLYWTQSAAWLQSATNQLTQDGAEPAWSLNGWSFVPVDTPNVVNIEDKSVRNHY